MPCQLRAVTAAVAAGTALGQMLAVVGGVAQKCAVGQLLYGSGRLRKNFRLHGNGVEGFPGLGTVGVDGVAIFKGVDADDVVAIGCNQLQRLFPDPGVTEVTVPKSPQKLRGEKP